MKYFEYNYWGHIQNALFSSKLTNGPNNLEYYIMKGWKGYREQTLKLIRPIFKLQRIKHISYFLIKEENYLL